MKKILAFAILLFFAVSADASEVVSVSDTVVEKNIIFDFKIKKGWHILAENPGDIGLPTVVEVVGPKKAGSEWSPPSKYGDDLFVQYGYSENARYVFVAKDRPDEYVAKISWLACRGDECLPQEIVLQRGGAERSYWHILLLAFFGGIVLNLMPCIFPILSLKAISLMQSSQKASHIRIESLLYLLGVVCSFLIIATVLMLLRMSGQEIGWGFQLQSPIFVSVLIAVFVVIFLMLLDIVNLKNPFANKVGRVSFNKAKLDSFVTGFFAVVIASPCTAPFMGAAIGYAVYQSPALYYPIFLALAIGYALPFCLIGFFPALYKVMPKSGKWMVILKKLFAIPIFLTIVWLAWVLSAQIKNDKTQDLLWQRYDAKKVEADILAGKSLLLNFTAKWCITCLANEKIAFEGVEFKKLVNEKNVVLYKADWTNKDEMIAKELRKYGRSSVPLYVYYKKGKKKILPQILTPKILKESLR